MIQQEQDIFRRALYPEKNEDRALPEVPEPHVAAAAPETHVAAADSAMQGMPLDMGMKHHTLAMCSNCGGCKLAPTNPTPTLIDVKEELAENLFLGRIEG